MRTLFLAFLLTVCFSAKSGNLEDLTRKAQSGDADAQNDVASELQQHKRYAEALAWYEKAAAQGHAMGIHNLAYLYDAGQLGPKDVMSACVWTMRARRFAGVYDEEVLVRSSRVLPFLRGNLSAAELDSCRLQADTWEPKGNTSR